MKSNGRHTKLYLNMRGDFNHVIIVTSSTCQKIENLPTVIKQSPTACDMDECRIREKAEFNVIFLRLRWKLEDVNQIAGWRPVLAYIQSGLFDLMLLTNVMTTG